MIRRVGAVGPSKNSAKKTSRFVYRPRTEVQVKARAEQSGGGFDSYLKPNIDMFRAKNGDNTVRFLPPTWEGSEHYGMDVWMHSWVGPDNSTYLCLNKNEEGGGGCPICKASKEAKDGGDADEAKQLAPTKRVLSWIIDRDDDNPHPIIYSQSWSQDREIAVLCENRKTKKILMIDHPYQGYDLSFKRTGQGLKTRYIGTVVDRDASPIMEDEKEQDEILDFIQENPIPSVLKFYSAEYLEKVISGAVDQKDDELDEKDERPARSTRSRDEEEEERPARSRRGTDEEDDKPVGRTRRSTEEEEPPRRSRRSAEDEEEEPPRRSSRRSEPEEEEETPRRSRRSEPEEEERPRRARREEPEEEERPRRTRREEPEDEAPRSRRSSREEPEEAPEEPRGRTRSRGAREEEDEAPRRSRRADPEDEPEEREEEVEEEEEAPRTRSRR
jgi:hypothetical protein